MKNDEIVVSVICLTYNHALYVRNTLEGFVRQKTTFRFEVIVHDDASLDETPSIIKEYSTKYPELFKIIIQSENQYSKGIDIIRTYMCPLITGKYVAFCEGDDYWCDPLKIQKQVDSFLKNDVVMVSHNTEKITHDGKHISFFQIPPFNGYLMPDDLITKANNRNPALSSLMIRRDVFDGFYSKETPSFFKYIQTDNALRLYCLRSGKCLNLLDTMSVYRVFSKGSWNSRMKKNKPLQIKLREKKIVFFVEYDKYASYIFHHECVKAIEKNEFEILVLKRDFSKARKHPLYKTLKLRTKLKLFLLSIVKHKKHE